MAYDKINKSHPVLEFLKWDNLQERSCFNYLSQKKINPKNINPKKFSPTIHLSVGHGIFRLALGLSLRFTSSFDLRLRWCGGLAVGLAARNVVGNLIASFLIQLNRPFVEGDEIQDAKKNLIGVVEEHNIENKGRFFFSKFKWVEMWAKRCVKKIERSHKIA